MLRSYGVRIATRAKEYLRYLRASYPFSSRLGIKFLAIIFGTVLIGTVLSSVLVLVQQHGQLMDDAHRSVQRVGTTMQASIEHAMLTNNRTMIAQLLQAVATEAGFRQISILDKDGRVWVHSEALQPREQSAPGSVLCQACHPSSRSATFKLESDCEVSGDYLVHTTTISNQPACYGCHDAAFPTLGVVSLRTPLSSFEDEWLSSIFRVVWVGLIITLLLAGCLTLALGRFVVQPVVQLSRVAAEVGSGNLDLPPIPHRGDELGELAGAFDKMRVQLQGALVEKERRNRELQLLNELARATSSLLDPQQVLDLTINIAVSSLGVQAGAIYLLDRESGRF